MKETLIKKIIEYVGELLSEDKVAGVFGLADRDGHIGPFLFTDPSQLDMMSLGDRSKPGDARYPLVKLLRPIVEAHPTKTFGVIVRGCDERALYRLHEESIYLPGQVMPIGFSCPSELAEDCRCYKPWPDQMVAGDQTPGVDPDQDSNSDIDITTQLQTWFDTFDRCLMCFGCRNVCPVCSCKECTVQEEMFIPQRQLPTSRDFLMTRAVHMVNRCVYCGLCEKTCPADIPLKSLYKLVAKATGRPESGRGFSGRTKAA